MSFNLKQRTDVFLFFLLIFTTIINGSLCPPFTGPVAQFCDVNITRQLCVGGNLSVGGVILGGHTGYANTLIVDKDGDDAIATRDNRLHFRTITAALAQALPGDLVWVFQGIYEEIITIPPGVFLVGNAQPVIRMLDVTQPTDLVTMSPGSQINGFTLLLTAASDVALRGLVLPGTGPTTIINMSVTVVAVPTILTTELAYGISYANPGTPGSVDSAILLNSVVVSVDGSGRKRALYVDQPDVTFIAAAGSFFSIGPSNTIGVETNNPTAAVRLASCQISGDNADISQTQGRLEVNSTELVHSEANTFGFGTTIYPTNFIWGTEDVIPAGTIRYLRPGTASLSLTPIPIVATQKFLAKALSIHLEVAPGLGESITVTLQRKVPLGSPQPTQLTVTVTDNDVQAVIDDLSVHFDGGDEMSVQVVSSAGSAAAAATVVIDIY